MQSQDRSSVDFWGFDEPARLYGSAGGVYTGRMKAGAILFILFLVPCLSAQTATAKKKLDISVDTGMEAFSPNGDGIRDTQVFEIDSTTSGADGWSIAISPSGGGPAVFHDEGTGKIPKKIEWDGTLDSGGRAPDGHYWSEINVRKTRNNITIRTNEFILDTTAPSARIFAAAGTAKLSPDGDGSHDSVSIVQNDVSPEKLWTGRVTAADGTVVRSAEWKAAPASFEWDGKRTDGTTVPDGKYTYELSATDLAGNAFSSVVPLRVDTLLRSVTIATSATAFSPNGDGKQDAIVLIPSANRPEGLLAWRMEIRGGSAEKGRTVRTEQGSILPKTLVWDGKTAGGVPAPDGQYTAGIYLEFDNGQACDAGTDAFFLATMLGPASVVAETGIFSPDGDKRKDTIVLRHEIPDSPVPAAWKGEIADGTGKTVRSWIWESGPPALTEWDGRTGSGKIAPNGIYEYRVSGLDRAGNAWISPPAAFVLDARKPVPVCTAGTGPFSPNGDGKFDVKPFTLASSITEGIGSWTLSIRTAGSDKPVAEIRGQDSLPANAVWDGTGPDGSILPDGTYTATLTVNYLKGNEASTKPVSFLLDTSPPRLKLGASPQPFSPDGDGFNDRLEIVLSARDGGSLADWSVDVMDPAGNVFMRFAGEGAVPEKIVWDGLDGKGELIQADMDYRLSFSAADTGANAAQTGARLRVDILVLREGDNWRIPLPGIAFPAESGDLDALPDDMRKANDETLDRLAVILKKFKTYRVLVEGHANSARAVAGKTPDPAEQEKELIPLSTLRALAVKNALIARGIAPERLESAGIGGARPQADFGDTSQSWKNRRVEFMLRK